MIGDRRRVRGALDHRRAQRRRDRAAAASRDRRRREVLGRAGRARRACAGSTSVWLVRVAQQAAQAGRSAARAAASASQRSVSFEVAQQRHRRAAARGFERGEQRLREQLSVEVRHAGRSTTTTLRLPAAVSGMSSTYSIANGAPGRYLSANAWIARVFAVGQLGRRRSARPSSRRCRRASGRPGTSSRRGPSRRTGC